MRAMPFKLDIEQTRRRIADVYAERERLKHDLDCGVVPAQAGLPKLDAIDRELSGLDSHFKALWDAHHPRAHDDRDSKVHPMNEVRP